MLALQQLWPRHNSRYGHQPYRYAGVNLILHSVSPVHFRGKGELNQQPVCVTQISLLALNLIPEEDIFHLALSEVMRFNTV